MAAEWWSQKFAEEGSAVADGIMRQLGQPRLDPLTVLTREAAQNSWDARAGDEVEFNIDISHLGDRVDAWRDHLTRSRPAESGLLGDLRWDANTLVMTVSDRGTVGLGGPIRAGVVARENERADFVQFLRNVGEPRDQALGGGTYGFGKGIYYTVSNAAAIVVDTHSVDVNAPRRLMGAAMTTKWERGNSVFTGRHWWGEVVDGIPDPLLGSDARSLAQDLGLPGFDDDEHGTDVVILNPNLGMLNESTSRSIDEAIRFIRASMVWHLWPKTVPGTKGVMRFSTSVDGVRIPVPHATELKELVPFVSALHVARRREGSEYTRKTPPRDVGTLALQIAPATQLDGSEFDVARPFDKPLRHVARMREVELVIDYFEGEEHPAPGFAYAGVFLASEEADKVFVRAEPPTHDAWVTEGLKGTDLGVVTQLKPFLKREIAATIRPEGERARSDSTLGLGRLSARLGSLTRGFAGTGAGDDAPVKPNPGGGGGGGGGGGTGKRVARPRVVEGPSIVVESGRAFLRSLVEIPSSGDARRVTGDVRVVVDGGGVEGDPPDGAPAPRVSWRASGAHNRIDFELLELEAGPAERWWFYTDLLEDAAVRVTVDWSN